MKNPLIISALVAVLALGQATASAFEQPKVYELKPKDHVVIFGDSTTVADCKPAGTWPAKFLR